MGRRWGGVRAFWTLPPSTHLAIFSIAGAVAIGARKGSQTAALLLTPSLLPRTLHLTVSSVAFAVGFALGFHVGSGS